MREKAIVDEQCRERLLKYISHLVIETLRPNVSDDDVAEQFGEKEFGPHAFCPFPQPGSEEFELQKQLDLYDLVLSRNMHSNNHTSTCFKYLWQHKEVPIEIPSIASRGDSNGSRDRIDPVETRRCMAEWIQPMDHAHATSQPRWQISFQSNLCTGDRPLCDEIHL